MAGHDVLRRLHVSRTFFAGPYSLFLLLVLALILLAALLFLFVFFFSWLLCRSFRPSSMLFASSDFSSSSETKVRCFSHSDLVILAPSGSLSSASAIQRELATLELRVGFEKFATLQYVIFLFIIMLCFSLLLLFSPFLFSVFILPKLNHGNK